MSDYWWDFLGLFDDDRSFDTIGHLDGTGGNDFDGIFDYNDPKEVDRIARDDPIAGSLFSWWYDYNERKDREQMDKDYQKNAGGSWKNSKYPWYSYRNNSYSGSSNKGGYGSFAEEFGVNDSIMKLYKKRW